jgi:hypothetical protein
VCRTSSTTLVTLLDLTSQNTKLLQSNKKKLDSHLEELPGRAKNTVFTRVRG